MVSCSSTYGPRRCPRDRARRRRGRTVVSADKRARQTGGLLRRPVPHHRLRPQQLPELRATAASSSPRSTSRCRSTGTFGRAGASSRRSLASSSRFCPRRNVSANSGIWAPLMPSFRICTPSSGKARGTSSCWLVITSTRWITAGCCRRTSRLRRGRDARVHRGANRRWSAVWHRRASTKRSA